MVLTLDGTQTDPRVKTFAVDADRLEVVCIDSVPETDALEHGKGIRDADAICSVLSELQEHCVPTHFICRTHERSFLIAQTKPLPYFVRVHLPSDISKEPIIQLFAENEELDNPRIVWDFMAQEVICYRPDPPFHLFGTYPMGQSPLTDSARYLSDLAPRLRAITLSATQVLYELWHRQERRLNECQFSFGTSIRNHALIMTGVKTTSETVVG